MIVWSCASAGPKHPSETSPIGIQGEPFQQLPGHICLPFMRVTTVAGRSAPPLDRRTRPPADLAYTV